MLIGTHAESAETRGYAWLVLNQTYEPSLARPLAYVVLSDRSPEVRRMAAQGLRDYLPFADAKAALEYAADNDESTEIRLFARMMTLSRDEQRDFARATLLDEKLAPAERLSLLSVPESANAVDWEVSVAVAHIVAATDDPALKRKAVWALTSGPVPPPPEVLEVLIANAADPDADVARANRVDDLRGRAGGARGARSSARARGSRR